MIDRNDELHSELMRAFNCYFKANQKWVTKGTRKAGMQARFWLSEIRRIAKAQRQVIMNWRYDIDAEKKEKKAQNGSGKRSNPDN